MPRIKKISKEEREILDNFFESIKKVLKVNLKIKESEIDWEAFKFILSHSSFGASEYFKAFEALPDSAKGKILENVGGKDVTTLKREFKRALNVYNSAIRVRK